MNVNPAAVADSHPALIALLMLLIILPRPAILRHRTEATNIMQEFADTALRNSADGCTTTAQESPTPSNYCPVCSERLTARKCKLFCQICGYYMSCSDYY